VKAADGGANFDSLMETAKGGTNFGSLVMAANGGTNFGFLVKESDGITNFGPAFAIITTSVDNGRYTYSLFSNMDD